VQAQVAGILGPGRTIVSIASWADQIRNSRPETGNWHFVDIPIGKTHLDMTRDCAKGDCVVAKIAELRGVVRDPATPPERRREALMFLIHFVGDMHEPLHSSDNDDKGGNTVKVMFHDRQTNLHSLWDSGLLNRMPPEDQLFPELSAAAARNAHKWRKGTVEQWAEQSHKVACKVTYGLLPKNPAGTPIVLGPDYETTADAAIMEQLAKAGVRLAAVLNQTLR
jgi:hypothetical protein